MAAVVQCLLRPQLVLERERARLHHDAAGDTRVDDRRFEGTARPRSPARAIRPDVRRNWTSSLKSALLERALCAQTDPESFFPEKGGSTREAKKVCSGCLVRAECLEYALADDERFGIWGGMSERERRRLKRMAG